MREVKRSEALARASISETKTLIYKTRILARVSKPALISNNRSL